MKTLFKTKKPAYEERLRVQKTVKDHLIHHTGISEDKYHLFQFETGCNLVEDFFENMAYTSKIRNHLLVDPKSGYWKWFKMQWDAWERDFWISNKWIVMERKEPKFFKSPDSDEKTLLHKSWKEEMAMMAYNKDMHLRLHHHIIQTNSVIL